MNREKYLVQSTFIIFLGTLCTKLVSYLLLPLYTGILSTSEYGTVELLNTLILLVVPIIGLHIDQGVFRYLIGNRDNVEEKKKLLSSSFYFMLFSNVLCFILFMCICPLIRNDYKWLLIINIILCSMSSLLLQIARGLGDNKQYSITGFITACVTIFFNIIFLVVLHMKVNGLLIANAIGYLSGSIYIFIKLKLFNYISIKNVNKKSINDMIRYSLPLVPNELSWWIFSSSDRFIIAAFIDLSSTGILSISYKFSNILIVIYNVFNMSLAESISLHIKDSDVGKYFNKVFNDVFKLFVSFGILLLAFMPILFKLLINSSYNDAYNLIPIAIVASLFQIVVGLLGTIYVANKNTKSIANSSIVAAIVNIVIDLLLVKYIGIYAAVVSTLVSYLILMIYRYIDIKKKYLDVKFNKKSTILNILILSIVIFAYYIDNPLVKIITMAISVIYFFYINKQSLNLMFNMLKSKINEKGEQK